MECQKEFTPPPPKVDKTLRFSIVLLSFPFPHGLGMSRREPSSITRRGLQISCQSREREQGFSCS